MCAHATTRYSPLHNRRAPETITQVHVPLRHARLREKPQQTMQALLRHLQMVVPAFWHGLHVASRSSPQGTQLGPGRKPAATLLRACGWPLQTHTSNSRAGQLCLATLSCTHLQLHTHHLLTLPSHRHKGDGTRLRNNTRTQRLCKVLM